MPKRFVTINVTVESKEEFKAMRDGFMARASLAGFFEEIIDYYKKHHCPECGVDVSKIKKHKC